MGLPYSWAELKKLVSQCRLCTSCTGKFLVCLSYDGRSFLSQRETAGAYQKWLWRGRPLATPLLSRFTPWLRASLPEPEKISILNTTINYVAHLTYCSRFLSRVDRSFR